MCAWQPVRPCVSAALLGGRLGGVSGRPAAPEPPVRHDLLWPAGLGRPGPTGHLELLIL